jgi:hypothetical protein
MSNQQGDDRDHHQQFDQRESRTPGTHRTTPSVAALYGDGNAFLAPDGTTTDGFEARTHSSIPKIDKAFRIGVPMRKALSIGHDDAPAIVAALEVDG